MKKLILVRHAKSSWEYNVADHERPLNTRGYTDANRVSQEIIDDVNPDLILSSNAVRAKTTAEIFVSNLGVSVNKIILNPALYDFSGSDLVRVIKKCDKSINELMVFGHNHAITNVVNTFGDMYIDNVPTSGLAILQFEIDDWNDLKKGKTIKTVFPKQL